MSLNSISISVVIPLYDQSHFLDSAIEAVLRQTLESWELLVIDDGSSDDPERIIFKYRDSRIRLLRQDHLGLSSARNRGVRESRYDFIAFLDADDIWSPSFLEVLSKHLSEDQKKGVAFCYCDFIDRNGAFLSRGPRPPAYRISNVSEYWMLRSPPHGCGSSFMIRRQAHLQAGGFDESLAAYEDVDFFLKVLRKTAFSISGIQKVLVGYRLHRNSLSADYSRLEYCLSQITRHEKDTKVSCAFLNRYIAQREMLIGGKRLSVICRLAKSFYLSGQLWTTDFPVTLQTTMAALAYILLPKPIFYKLLKMRFNYE